MDLMQCPTSGLMLPKKFVDEKQSLKKSIDSWVEKAVQENQYIKGSYFLTFHAKFNAHDSSVFEIDAPKVTKQLPPFMSNSLVFWVCNKKSVCELLWMVSAKKPGQKLKVEFNKTGVAYLQAKGAMPTA